MSETTQAQRVSEVKALGARHAAAEAAVDAAWQALHDLTKKDSTTEEFRAAREAWLAAKGDADLAHRRLRDAVVRAACAAASRPAGNPFARVGR
jgi:hypothetical protein